ncbi:MAG: hypothetical protein IJX14_03380 [Clostridia bacterium]|nr:hypothetical protein [Clostridia bacterium]
MKIRKKKAIPEEVACQYCTEYIKPIGCTAPECIILTERLEAGVVGYEELISTTFNYNRTLFRRLQTCIKYFPGTLWRDEYHESRFLYATAGCCDIFMKPKYYAAVYLLTADEDLYKRCSRCFMRSGISFRNVRIQGIGTFGYTLLAYAKKLYGGMTDLPMGELLDDETIPQEEFTLIVNAMMIVKHGTDIFKIDKTTTER